MAVGSYLTHDNTLLTLYNTLFDRIYSDAHNPKDIFILICTLKYDQKPVSI